MVGTAFSRKVGSWATRVGRPFVRGAQSARGLIAFGLITLGVLWSKGGHAPVWLRHLTRHQIVRAGVTLLPLFLFLSAILGFLVIGQTVAWLSRLGAMDYLGPVMVLVIVRELGPLMTALVMLARVCTPMVVELSTARALGEVEALEALGIDPIHYLVVPRVLGLALSVLGLTVYLILGAIVAGYLWAFLQNIPLTPGAYFRQLAAALSWLDFGVLALKTLMFGAVLATVTCYHGLARPLRLDGVAPATVHAVGQGLVACLLLDAVFLLLYLVAA
ncbi:MAG: ABC transporter permease [Verrucomicrobiota bacterium]|nr:ABC transporter permease [Verrucomicrobiota bacterium]